MKIKTRQLVDGDIILVEVEADKVQDFKDCAIVHHRNKYYIDGKKRSTLEQWVVYDIPTGLLIVYGSTRKQCLDRLFDRRFEVAKARDTELYQRRIKEFEELQKL